MMQYSQIKESLLAIKRALEAGELSVAMSSVDDLLVKPEFQGVSVCSVIGVQDIKKQVDSCYIVNGASPYSIDELAERYAACTGETLNELASEYLDIIQSPEDFVKEYPQKDMLIPSELLDMVESWIQDLPVTDGKIQNDFMYWNAGTEYSEISEWFDRL